ncbi:2,3-bisphosphoglycerate-dependent phosphoglycerate mutase [Flavobacterium sp. PL11]|jgi:2,3-bisphosphoglycerate-dependent phosphoglycerate mutase|uniref:SixA phosphatase family protein n=1 Tax=Flavobacterium sp. PL11 TaxID=3071717 RepID=UPI002DFC3156|nr:2,3-bisphosphoglycerate-dependent phosphoglycerate mutase [Flavobacterium sp. PL11]
MKKIFIILTFFIFQLSIGQNITTYYFIRHAEKIDDSKNPDLSNTGLERAKSWNQLFSQIKFDVIYSTDYNRTLQTVEPIAISQNIKTTIYDPKTVDINKFIKKNLGKKVLIVGHSNTIPKFINQIIDQEVYKDIEDNTFGNLYIVHIFQNEISHQLLKL